VLAHRSTKMKLCDSQKHFIPNLSKPVTAAYTGETVQIVLNEKKNASSFLFV
jgi:hypothetical protein